MKRLKYKEDSLTNDQGHPLRKCQCCHGDGRLHSATKWEQEGTKPGRTVTRAIRDDAVRAYKRDGWDIESSPCTACGGSGLVKAEAEKA